MQSTLLTFASALGFFALVSADYTINTNTNCGTQSDIDYQRTYYYDPNDTMDWGFYLQSTGTCDAGSGARVHFTDPIGNDIDCGYFPLDGNLNLVSCANYPRGYMQEGQYTLYIETNPSASQYSWNQFTISHSQGTVTGATQTSTINTTPMTVTTSTAITTPSTTVFLPQQTVTSPSATMTNYVTSIPPVTTVTSTSTSTFIIPIQQYQFTTITAITTAPCYRAKITRDFLATRNIKQKVQPVQAPKPKLTNIFSWWWRRSEGVAKMFETIHEIRHLRLRDDVPNTVGVAGPPPTTTIQPSPVIVTATAPTSTSTVTVISSAASVTITTANPTPTITIFSGVAVDTITTTLSQSTKLIMKTKYVQTITAVTATITHTKKSVTTPICVPTPV